MAEISFFEDLPKPKQIEVASYLADYTSSKEGQVAKLRPLSAQKILADEHVALVALEGSEFAGYITPGEIYYGQNAYQMVGSLVVPAAFRGQDIAEKLVYEAASDVVGQWCIPFAFCNHKSLPIFTAVGFELALPGQLPPEAQSQFGNTPVIYLKG